MFCIHDVHEYPVETADATMIVFGDVDFLDDGFRLTYREEEGDLAGCTTQVTCSGDELVSVSRTGPFSTNLTMERGKRHHCQYETEFGTMLMGVFAEEVDAEMDVHGGHLNFVYNIDFDGDFISRNTLHITVKETF